MGLYSLGPLGERFHFIIYGLFLLYFDVLLDYGIWTLEPFSLFNVKECIEGKNSIPKHFLRRQAHKSTPVRYLDIFKEPWESISGLPP